jgi:hypothetical protein
MQERETSHVLYKGTVRGLQNITAEELEDMNKQLKYT